MTQVDVGDQAHDLRRVGEVRAPGLATGAGGVERVDECRVRAAEVGGPPFGPRREVDGPVRQRPVGSDDDAVQRLLRHEPVREREVDRVGAPHDVDAVAERVDRARQCGYARVGRPRHGLAHLLRAGQHGDRHDRDQQPEQGAARAADGHRGRRRFGRLSSTSSTGTRAARRGMVGCYRPVRALGPAPDLRGGAPSWAQAALVTIWSALARVASWRHDDRGHDRTDDPATPSAASSARAGGYAKGRATREEILDAAMQLFGEVGYHTASLREVASRVGISHPGLLHHFSSKAVLLAAVLERRDEVDEAAFEADLAAGHDYFDALARLIERNAARPGIVELFATLSAEATSPDHPAHAYFQDRYRTVVGPRRPSSSAGATRAGSGPASTRSPPPASRSR